MGVMCCIISFFAIILLVGLFKKNKILLLIWCYYIIVGGVIFIIFFLAVGIFSFINSSIGLGALFLAVAIIIGGQQTYCALVVHSIYLNFKDAEQQHTSYPQHS